MKRIFLLFLWGRVLFGFSLSDLYIEPNGRLSYTKSSYFTSTSQPLLFAGAFGFTAAYWLHEDYFLGLSSELTFVNQYSAVDTMVGNNRGVRWNILSPTLGWRVFKSIILKAEFEFLGNYNLLNPLPGDQYLSYTNPVGLKFTLSFPVYNRLSLGILFEYITFSKIENSLLGSTTLGTRFALWQYGFAIGYTLF